MIASFAGKRTEAFHRGDRVAAFSGFARTASRKPDQLDAATGLRELRRAKRKNGAATARLPAPDDGDRPRARG